MEVVVKTRPLYYFSWQDSEILDENTLALSCDDETWLYKVERGSYNGHSELRSQPHQQSPSGCVDSRTFTRHKRCSLRPSLDSVVESPLNLSNRSSLGILSDSKLNDTKLMNCITPISISQERTSSSFTASDRKLPAPRVFKLDSPFMNPPSIPGNEYHSQNHTFVRNRLDSELSDFSIPLDNLSEFEKNGVMTDSLVNFLEKQDEKCHPPADFRDDEPMTGSLVSIPEKENSLEFDGEAMTESMVNFLAPVAFKPPSGFEDEEMSNSIVNIDDKNILPGSDMTNSLMDYLNCVKVKTPPSNEAENIPPVEGSNRTEPDIMISTSEKVDGAFKVEENSNTSPDITFNNNVNISRTKKEIIDVKDNRNVSKPINNPFGKESYLPKENSESDIISRALNNRDLNVTRDVLDVDTKDFAQEKLKVQNKTNATALMNSTVMNRTYNKSDINSTVMNRTFTKSDFSSTFNVSRQIPQRNSTFNTTFTKLELSSKGLSSSTQSLKKSNCTFTKSTDGLNGIEDDQVSSASDSSFSSGSTKPRSVDELRTIAQQQETNLKSSTPTERNHMMAANFTNLDPEFSPIRRLSSGTGRTVESRSAHCSPVRNPHPRSPFPHPVTKLQHQPLMESRRQTLQASSLSNLAKPRASGLRMPQPVSRMSMAGRPEPRPSTAPAPAYPTTGIPRPQTSRLPMPCFRSSGIPKVKRGGTTRH